MTASRAPADPEAREFETSITRIDGRDVVLSETYFYPESGGQPADRGLVAGQQVVDVQEHDGTVVHTLADDPDFGVDERVACRVDAEFRTYCMRAHTASHVLYGAGRRRFDELGYAGFDIGTEKVRVDLETGRDVDDEELVELERLSNRAVWDSLPVTWEQRPVEEARGTDPIAFNTKTEEGVMADADTVRVVTIDGWDTAACGGTHVSNTAEIGPIEVLERSNPGAGMTRIEFAVGPTGIDRGARVHESALAAARAVGTSIEDLPESVDRLDDERRRLEAELMELKNEVLAARLDGLDRIDRGGERWAVGTVSEFDANEVSDPLKELVGENGDVPDVAVVVGDDDAPFVVAASAGEVDAGDVVADLTAEFGGGGGGGPTFAQGGGLDADSSELLASLRE